MAGKYFGKVDQRELSIGTPLGGETLLFWKLHGSERMGRLPEYHLKLLSKDPEINLEKLIGERVTVRLNLPHVKKERYIDGFVTEFGYETQRGNYAVYHATVHPWLWFLKQTTDCRIFQNMTVPEIITGIFRELGFTDFEQKLSGTYVKRIYCVQYRESDFNFVSRLMENEGIYYYFKHEDAKHTLVLADSYSAHEPIKHYPTIEYSPPGESTQHRFEHIHDWRVQQRVHSGELAMTSYDFEKPRVNLDVKQTLPRSHTNCDFQLYDDFPGPYLKAAEGTQYAKLWLESLEATYKEYHGQCIARGLMSGGLFKLKAHPRAKLNQEYLVVGAEYQMQSGEYETTSSDDPLAKMFECSFLAIESKQPYRTPRTTPRPIVEGPQTAFVVGQKGQEIWTDKYGRVKVQFHWDRLGKADENSSCWIRVSQVWAGKGWGGMHIPRIGQEVIVDFLEGDPDQPIITGRVYNGEAIVPYALPANATMSTIKSNSSKGGGGFNEFRFEDKKGMEQVFIHAQKDYDLRILNDRKEWTTRDMHVITHRNQFEQIDGKHHNIVKMERVTDIGADDNLKVGGKQSIQITASKSEKVTGNVAESYMANQATQVGANLSITAGANVVIEATNITLKGSGGFITICPAGIMIQGTMVLINSGGAAIPAIPGILVPPMAAIAALIADKADPGAMDKPRVEVPLVVPPRKVKPGVPAAAMRTPAATAQLAALAAAPQHDSKAEENKDKKEWVEVAMVDEAGQPVVGEPVTIKLPDGSVATGSTDDKGMLKITNIDPGQVEITYPDLDDKAWK